MKSSLKSKIILADWLPKANRQIANWFFEGSPVTILTSPVE